MAFFLVILNMLPLIPLLCEIMNIFLSLHVICISHSFLCSFIAFLPIWRFCASMCCPFVYHRIAE